MRNSIMSMFDNKSEKKQGRIHEPKSRAGGQERRKSKALPTNRQTDGQTDGQSGS